jgi:phosphotransferase system enzyme I (PtsI)
MKVADGDVLAASTAASGHGRAWNPLPPDLRGHRARMRDQAREQSRAGPAAPRSRARTTRRRRHQALLANAESRADVDRGARAGRARASGLYRTEFLFLQRDELPDEEEQFRNATATPSLGMSGTAR